MTKVKISNWGLVFYNNFGSLFISIVVRSDPLSPHVDVHTAANAGAACSCSSAPPRSPFPTASDSSLSLRL